MRVTKDLTTTTATILGCVTALGIALDTPKTSPYQDLVRLSIGSAVFCVSSKMIQEYQEDLNNQIQINADDKVRAAVIDANARCQVQYYSLYPEKYRQGRPVPDEWRVEFLKTIPEFQSTTIGINEGSLNNGLGSFNGSFNNGLSNLNDGINGYNSPHVSSVFDEIKTDDTEFWNQLLNPSALLIYGGDGSGKTTFAKALIAQRILKANHEVVALDPHGSSTSWKGCRVVGQGLNFSAIETEIDNVMKLVKSRYQAIAEGTALPKSFPHLTIVCEEMTDWSASVSNAGLLINKMGDYRKVNVHLLMVAHGNTMGQIAAPKGSNEILNNCLMQLHLFSKPSETGEPIPAFKGSLKHPGVTDCFDVSIPQVNLTELTSQLRDINPSNIVITNNSLKNIQGQSKPVQGQSQTVAEQSKTVTGQSKPVQGQTESELCKAVAFYLKADRSDSFIIENIWGLSPESVGTIQYKTAQDFLERIKGLIKDC